jgi:hypothetical protein
MSVSSLKLQKSAEIIPAVQGGVSKVSVLKNGHVSALRCTLVVLIL